MKARKTLAIVGGACLVAAAYAYSQTKSELTTVASVRMDRYVGRWYEIARYPNRFQKKCAGDTMATYTRREDGKIEVLNQCRKADGSIASAKGKAKVADKKTNAKLRVTFFWPFYGDYWVIGLDPEYRWAVVGEPSRKYLWILSRTPQMTDADYERALAVVREKGYEPERLMRTAQKTVTGAATSGGTAGSRE